jgi:hypothetical protein
VKATEGLNLLSKEQIEWIRKEKAETMDNIDHGISGEDGIWICCVRGAYVPDGIYAMKRALAPKSVST